MSKLKFLKFTFLITIFLLVETSLQAAYTFHKGRLVNTYEAATLTVQEHFDIAACSYNEGKWEEAAKHFCIVSVNFPSTPYGQEAFYFLGVSYFFLEEYDFANEALSNYLKVQSNPRYFESAIEFKFCIAEHLSAGARCRPFGTKQLPKWMSGQNLSLQVFDEVIAAVPCHEIAAKALIAKACMLWRWQDYRGAIDALQMEIRRFPKYESTPDCYIYIGKIYLEQSRWEFQNSDILAFAQINVKRFERDFPKEERLAEALADVEAIKEIYADGLYQTGKFYERKSKYRAAIIYYNDAIRQFPETCVASLCRKRMACLHPECYAGLPEIVVEDDSEEISDEIEDLDGLDLQDPSEELPEVEVNDL